MNDANTPSPESNDPRAETAPGAPDQAAEAPDADIVGRHPDNAAAEQPPAKGASGHDAHEAVGSEGRSDEAEVVGTDAGGLGGHRVTRRTVHRRVETEDVEEEVTEVLPPHAYTAPHTDHPAPVG